MKIKMCDCGNVATIKYCSAHICDRCHQLQLRLFKDKNYCGMYLEQIEVKEKLAAPFSIYE